MSSPDPAATPSTAAAWLARGQQHEAEGTPASLATALACYDRALELLRLLPDSPDPQHLREFGVTWMNRGNALQKLATPASLADAVAAYDEAIALLKKLPTHDPAHGNSLGAAWMNRGHALAQQDAAALPAAILAYQEAIAVLQRLPIAEHRSARINLAAAWMNLANALLLFTPPRAADARSAAQTSLVLTGEQDSSDQIIADIALKARRVQCDALGHLLVIASTQRAPTQPLADEAADAVDQGLALVRHWEFHGVQHFRPTAARLYRFGARLSLIHQPHFLAEFLLESIDPTRAPGALTGDTELHAFAAEFIPHALATLRATSLIGLAPAQAQRLHEAVRDLESAQARLSELRPNAR